jgi:hypothetical protein
MTNTGNTTLELIDEETEEVSDEQLQRLGIEEYPERPEPHWVGGFDFWGGTNAATTAIPRGGTRINWDEISEMLARQQEANNERVRQITQLQYQPQMSTLHFGDPVNRNGNGSRFYSAQALYSNNVNPIVYDYEAAPIHGLSSQWTVVDEVAEPVEPELNIEEPSYENLQEMMRIAAEESED